MIWGLNPGPTLFIERPDFVWGLIASMYLGNVVAVVVVLATVPLFASILRIPFSIIGPVIVVICFIGAYTVGSKEFDIWLRWPSASSATSSRSSTTRSRRSCSPWSSATRPRTPSASR
jgi:TctA family transporter